MRNDNIRNGIADMADRHAERVKSAECPWNAEERKELADWMDEREFTETYDRYRNWFCGALLAITVGGMVLYYLR